MSHLIALNMKTKKLFSMLAVALMMAISTPLMGDVPQEQEVIYDLGEVTITCSSQGYGKCYYPIHLWAGSNQPLGEYICIPTGDPENHCPHLLVKILNFLLSGI